MERRTRDAPAPAAAAAAPSKGVFGCASRLNGSAALSGLCRRAGGAQAAVRAEALGGRGGHGAVSGDPM
jgi:hypothetical protein